MSLDPTARGGPAWGPIASCNKHARVPRPQVDNSTWRLTAPINYTASNSALSCLVSTVNSLYFPSTSRIPVVAGWLNKHNADDITLMPGGTGEWVQYYLPRMSQFNCCRTIWWHSLGASGIPPHLSLCHVASWKCWGKVNWRRQGSMPV